MSGNLRSNRVWDCGILIDRIHRLASVLPSITLRKKQLRGRSLRKPAHGRGTSRSEPEPSA